MVWLQRPERPPVAPLGASRGARSGLTRLQHEATKATETHEGYSASTRLSDPCRPWLNGARGSWGEQVADASCVFVLLVPSCFKRARTDHGCTGHICTAVASSAPIRSPSGTSGYPPARRGPPSQSHMTAPTAAPPASI